MKTPRTTTPRTKATSRQVYRRRARSWRRPVGGLIGPRQSVVLAIDPPLRPNEQPVAVSPNAGDIMMRDVTTSTVTISNETDRVVAYLMTVVPRFFVKAAMVPWRRVAADLGQALKNSGVLERFARFLNR